MFVDECLQPREFVLFTLVARDEAERVGGERGPPGDPSPRLPGLASGSSATPDRLASTSGTLAHSLFRRPVSNSPSAITASRCSLRPRHRGSSSPSSPKPRRPTSRQRRYPAGVNHLTSRLRTPLGPAAISSTVARPVRAGVRTSRTSTGLITPCSRAAQEKKTFSAIRLPWTVPSATRRGLASSVIRQLERLHVLRHGLVPAQSAHREEVQPHPHRVGVLAPGVLIPGEHPRRREEPVHPPVWQAIRSQQERLPLDPIVRPQQRRQPIAGPLRHRIRERRPAPLWGDEEYPPFENTRARDHRRKLAPAPAHPATRHGTTTRLGREAGKVPVGHDQTPRPRRQDGVAGAANTLYVAFQDVGLSGRAPAHCPWSSRPMGMPGSNQWDLELVRRAARLDDSVWFIRLRAAFPGWLRRGAVSRPPSPRRLGSCRPRPWLAFGSRGSGPW